MKRYILFISLLLAASHTKAQINPQLLYNTWIKVKATYNNDKPIEYINIVKYSYVKYIFTNSGHNGINVGYTALSANNQFLINDSLITVTTPSGYPLNKFKIVKLSADELVIIQDDGSGFDKPDAWKFYLIPEKKFQNTHRFQPDEFSVMANGDTLYNVSQYVYPKFGVDNDFQYEAQKNISASVSMDSQEGHFLATFIVTKNGTVDSLKILNGINPDFDKAFLRFFTKNLSNWKPATLAGKPVNVKNKITFNYTTSDKMIPIERARANAVQALQQRNFEIALHYYEEILTYTPDDYETLYKATLCKLALGRTDGTCEALAKVNGSTIMMVDELISLVCRSDKN